MYRITFYALELLSELEPTRSTPAAQSHSSTPPCQLSHVTRLRDLSARPPSMLLVASSAFTQAASRPQPCSALRHQQHSTPFQSHRSLDLSARPMSMLLIANSAFSCTQAASPSVLFSSELSANTQVLLHSLKHHTNRAPLAFFAKGHLSTALCEHLLGLL